MTIERGKWDRESFIGLVQATNPLPTNPLESFTYDEVGNRVNSNQNGASVFNQANQLTEDGGFTYQYDANGSLTRKTNKVTSAFTSYEYDAENRLVRVVSNGTVADYRYDGLGRRVEKQVTQGPVTKVTRYIYDNEDILLELDGSNNITARYTHGPGIDEPLIMERGGASFFYHADGLGSITEITDSAGALRQQYTYSSFGKIESQLDPNFVQPYTFTAREFDTERGLYFYRARYYDPSAGRFLQEDPAGFRIGDANLYPYVYNDPVNLIDSTGESAQGALSTLINLAKWAIGTLPQISIADPASTADLARTPVMDQIRQKFLQAACKNSRYWGDYQYRELLGTTSVAGQVVGSFGADIRNVGNGQVIIKAFNTWGLESATRFPAPPWGSNRGNASIQQMLTQGAPLQYPKSLLENRSSGPMRNATIYYVWRESLSCPNQC